METGKGASMKWVAGMERVRNRNYSAEMVSARITDTAVPMLFIVSNRAVATLQNTLPPEPYNTISSHSVRLFPMSMRSAGSVSGRHTAF